MDEVRQRAEVHFAAAIFFKPRAGRPETLDPYLAPLIVQELTPDDDSARDPQRFGAVGASADGAVRIDTSRPEVYAGEAVIPIDGREHRQWIYVWVYPRDESGGFAARLPAQGVRVTLDSGGRPAIWEVLARDTVARVFFVSRSLELAAAKQYGHPLPHRRHAVEQSVGDQPDVIVARVLDDGPVPMGPIVYLRGDDRAVTTVICRCMPSQVDVLDKTTYYDLRPLHELHESGFDLADWVYATGRSEISLGFPVDASEDPNLLRSRLRLPARF